GVVGRPPRRRADHRGVRGARAGRRSGGEGLGRAPRDPLGSAAPSREDSGEMLAPLHLALRRLRARLFVAAATAVAVGGAAALVGWSSLAAASAQEQNVHLRLGALPPAKRAVRVVHTTAPLELDRDAATVRAAFASLRDVTGPLRAVRVWHPLAP